MKSTGVIRRIDDLGRIVIPKEIRKNLRIKDGESLEIFLESESIILKKYSQLENLNDFYKDYADSIYNEILDNVIIVDRNKFIAVSGDLKKKYLNKEISSSIDEIINNRAIFVSDGISKLFFTSELYEDCSYVISPIIVNGDVVGAFMIVSYNKFINDLNRKIAVIASRFLEKYIE